MSETFLSLLITHNQTFDGNVCVVLPTQSSVYCQGLGKSIHPATVHPFVAYPSNKQRPFRSLGLHLPLTQPKNTLELQIQLQRQDTGQSQQKVSLWIIALMTPQGEARLICSQWWGFMMLQSLFPARDNTLSLCLWFWTGGCHFPWGSWVIPS